MHAMSTLIYIVFIHQHRYHYLIVHSTSDEKTIKEWGLGQLQTLHGNQ